MSARPSRAAWRRPARLHPLALRAMPWINARAMIVMILSGWAIYNDEVIYYGSIDMPSALHPQTLLATKYAGEPIADPFGFPLRLRFKNPKWISAMEVTNDWRGGYWEDRGFNWFSGI